jgi:hypothetical protein
MNYTFPKGTKLICRWVDIVSEPNWKKLDELDAPPIITTIGFFMEVKVCHTKECLVLAGSIGQDDEIGNADTIPVGTIISLEEIL